MERLINRIATVASPGCVEFVTRPIPKPKDDEVLIRIVSSAICGSDLHIFKGKHPSAVLPSAIGHELSGMVVDVGKQVVSFKVGDRVTVEPVIVCGVCADCVSGNYGHCRNISFLYRRGDGALADYICVKEKHVYKLPDNLSYNEGALIEPLAVAVHAVRRADIKLGETVVIFGAGAIGILTAALCRRCGAAQVAVVDHNDLRLAKAVEMGATASINSLSQDVYAAIRELSNANGADKTFECVGKETTFNLAMSVLKKNGLATIVGIFEEPNITINAARFVTHEIHVQGAQGYCWDFSLAIEMASEIELNKMISHEFDLENVQEAFSILLNSHSEAMKIIVHP